MLNFQTWLETPSAVRGILVEAGVSAYNTGTSQWEDTTIYLSNIGYITKDSLTSYLPIIVGGATFSESLSLDGSLSMSFGDIEISNPNGVYDDWLDSTKFVWANKPIQVYYGSPLSVAANITEVRETYFEKIFEGIIADIDTRSRATLNIKVRDKLQRLNTPLTENKIGTYGTWAGGQQNQDNIRPLIFGEVHNVTPELIDPATLEYMFLDTSIGVIISKTTTGTNLIECSSTAGFVLDAPITFSDSNTTGLLIGGIVRGTTYYIKTINSSTTFTISSTAGGAVFALTTASAVSTNVVQAQVIGDRTAELVIEIRDNGVPIYTAPSIYTGSEVRPDNAIVNLTTGKFTLKYPASGAVTASIQGFKNTAGLVNGTLNAVYSDTVAKIIAFIVLAFGNSKSRLVPADLDLPNLEAFNAIHQQNIGIFIKDRENVLNVCTEIANSLGAQLYFNRLGKLQLLKIGVPTSDPVVYITDSDILFHSLEIVQRSEVVASTKIGYCKNWTVQEGLVTNIPMSHKTSYATEWRSKTAIDTAVKDQYQLNVDPVQKDTLLLKGTAASTEAIRLNDFFKVPRTVYRMTGSSKLMSLKLGQSVNLTHNRFGLTAGKTGQVVALSPNWLKSTIDIEVLI